MRLIDADAIDYDEYWNRNGEGFTIDVCQKAQRIIDEQPTIPSAEAVQGWIPCSERLPNEKGMYLVTSRKKATAEEFGFDLDDVEVKKMRFDEDGWRLPKHIPEWINGVIHITVLAWMPLPKPYREDGEA